MILNTIFSFIVIIKTAKFFMQIVLILLANKNLRHSMYLPALVCAHKIMIFSRKRTQVIHDYQVIRMKRDLGAILDIKKITQTLNLFLLLFWLNNSLVKCLQISCKQMNFSIPFNNLYCWGSPEGV